MLPCNNAHCVHWDSDKNGGHCMLVNPGWHYNGDTHNYYCSSFKAMVINRKIKKIPKHKKTLE